MFSSVPDVKSDIFLEKGQKSWFSIVVPEERTNLDTNPSYELGITGVNNVGGATTAQSSVDQRRGVYSCAITMGAGTTDGLYKAYSLAAATQYAISCDVRAPDGMPMTLVFTDAAGTTVYGRYQWVANGQWERVSCNGLTVTATTYRAYLQKNSSSKAGTVYTDGWQVEVGSYPTTYIDGDQQGVVTTRNDYVWNGTPHAATSTRIASCRVGGKVVNLRDYGFRLSSIVGGGLSGFENYATQLSTGGAYYHGTVITSRQLSLVGIFSANSGPQKTRLFTSFISAVAPGIISPDQPNKLIFQQLDCYDVPISNEVEILAVLEPGSLDGNYDNEFTEKVALVFTLHTPYLAKSKESGLDLTYKTTITNSDHIIANIQGVWQKLGASGAAGSIKACAIDPANGDIYIGGNFSSVGGVSATRVAKYVVSTGTWTALGTGCNDVVYSITFGPNGFPYFAGAFTTANGVTVNRITYWNGSTFIALGGTPGVGSAAEIAYALTFDSSGILYVGGDFTTAGGAAANRVASWNGSAWSAMGTGFSAGQITGLQFLKDQKLYATGYNTLSPASISYWTGSTWVSIGGATTGSYQNLVANDGTLIVPNITDPDTIASWNGVSWKYALPPSTLPYSVGMAGVAQIQNNAVVMGTWYAAAGTLFNIIFDAKLNAINLFDYYYTSSIINSGVNSLAYKNGTLVIVGAVTGTYTTAALNTITNSGTQISYPVFKFSGPGTLYNIRSYTTGAVIYFGLTLLDGEVAILDLTPGNIRFFSNLRPSLLSTILPGSMLTDLNLVPGSNKLSIFLAGTTGANTKAQIYWATQINNFSQALFQ